MASQVSSSSDFTETLAIHASLKAALKSKKFDDNPQLKKAAQKLCKEMDGENSIYGRQLKMLKLMQSGATVSELGRKLKTSRRTLFRYLNYLEEAGINIELRDNSYYVDKTVQRMIKM